MQQQQPPQQQRVNLTAANNASGMSRDSDDGGSSMSFIPQDRTSKVAVPDENIGNAIGGNMESSNSFANANQGGPTATSNSQFLNNNTISNRNSERGNWYASSNYQLQQQKLEP